jgi:molybdopterin-guanine dinucleotide biosynthesis protein A
MSDLVAAILAGGASVRMGTDKALLVRAGATLLERAAAAARGAGLAVTVVGRSQPRDWAIDGVSFIDDAHPGQGPMAAVLQALELAQGASVITMPCDLPNITADALRDLGEAYRRSGGGLGAVLVIDGAIQPLAAVYGAGVRELLARDWTDGERSLRRAIERERGFARIAIAGASASPWLDCDTPEQWRSIVERET